MKAIVIDDQPMVTIAFYQLLKSITPDAEITVCAKTEAFLASPSRCDLAIVGQDMDIADYEHAVQSIHSRFPEAQVVLYSQCLSRELVGNALRCGASGVIPKQASYEVILNALKLILAGDIYVPAARPQTAPVSSIYPAALETPKPQFSGLDERLSEREVEVLDLVVAGLSNKVIASRLQIAESTVKVHVSSILRLFNVNSRTQISYQVMRERHTA